MHQFTRISVILMTTLIFLLLANNLLYYFISKDNLRKETVNNLITQAQQINSYLENSRRGSHFVENLAGEKLRSDSIQIQSELDPDINNVSNEQLSLLAKKLNIKAITLLTKRGDSFVSVRSSVPEEINLDTKSWGLWNKAFLELYENKNVSELNWGQSLPNFWAGPISVSTTNIAESDKFGYYYDGTTNYIINPYLSDELFNDFNSEYGIDSAIQKSLVSNPSILEVTGINPATFGKKGFTVKNEAGQEYTPKYYIPIFFGSYNYKNDEMDTVQIKKALDLKKPVSYRATINGKDVFKTFVPVFTNSIDELGVLTPNAHIELEQTLDYYVMGITIDYNIIQNELNQTLKRLLLIVAFASVVCILILFVLNYYIRKTKDEVASQTQSTYISQINDFFLAIRGQRHDMANHLQTIYSLVQLKHHDELKKYTSELIGEFAITNDIIVIGHPAISALIQSKLAIADQRKIKFEYEFDSLTRFPLGLKSLDLVRILGNLIDNAFDAVHHFSDNRRKVVVRGHVKENVLYISVINPGEIMGTDVINKIFEPGYSTKDKSTHSGLGLAVTKQLIQKYRGSIFLNTDNPGMIELNVEISLV
ncbi:sensor histidine kinase [Paenibacillus sp. Y412MC10]|uniref:sensor histidine kinase n=1 Tax=Geobacillus sp. (strain Y412MC10) TaxID=481743 RepID=UPI0011AB4F3F|nr:GHKL domain-containing protein [Paenibacillus sp. Y412MC10]